jgi:hypothetical protein
MLHFSLCRLRLPICCCPLLLTSTAAAARLPEALSAPLAALRKAARQVGTAAADAKLGVNVDEFVERFRWAGRVSCQLQRKRLPCSAFGSCYSPWCKVVAWPAVLVWFMQATAVACIDCAS